MHQLRCLLDEVFMADNFINEIIWQHAVIGSGRGIYRCLPKAHETLLCYGQNKEYVFNTDEKSVRVPYKERITENLTEDEKGFYYTRGRTGTDNPWSKDPRYLRTYVDIEKGKLVHDAWDDITTYRAQGDEYVGYRTQKPEQLIDRVVSLFSSPGDLVLDCFCGSGTTPVVAQKLGRRWIACDINKGAIQTSTKRLQEVIVAELSTRSANEQQKTLAFNSTTKHDTPVLPAQLGFLISRINDYDLAIQHNEAVALVCDLVGITRTITDGFFDGTLGKKLTKIVPFAHPLSPADLEDVKRELIARPNDARDVVVVCLGKELSVDAWLSDWNRLRKHADTPNKIEIIELRTDRKYGKLIAHVPAIARINIRREKNKFEQKILIEVTDFVSPSIIERLQKDGGLLAPNIPDWRAMVDCIMIDQAYDGKIFNITLADVPERKRDYVQGAYSFDAPEMPTNIAVKITDMLGEEVLFVKTV